MTARLDHWVVEYFELVEAVVGGIHHEFCEVRSKRRVGDGLATARLRIAVGQ